VPVFDWEAWPLPPVFQWLQSVGGVSDRELRRTFNCGVGFVLVTAPENVEPVLAALLNAGETAFGCGQLQAL
jgi:phosphoribosylaminoimidazole (AIR) synthetase